MLFKQSHLNGIKSGKISLAFRKWKKPTVKKGSLVKTSVGQIEITSVDEIKLNQISDKDAAKAGYDKQDLIELLDSIADGTIYKIGVRYHSVDPRIKLRSQKGLTEEEFKAVKEKLERLDAYSKQGPWTINVLKVIRDHPELRAADLAIKTGKEKDWLKPNIRKLKNLGLTISHDVGYSLSPLGEVLLKRLTKSNKASHTNKNQ